MTIYETLKQVISPNITIWQLHTITIREQISIRYPLILKPWNLKSIEADILNPGFVALSKKNGPTGTD